MLLALIPPIERRADTYTTDMQLVLPHLLEIPTYSFHYKSLRSYAYTILDNGAAEAQQPNAERLLEVINDFRPNEFALPDVLGDVDATVASSITFLQTYGKCTRSVRFGYVAQGQFAGEACCGIDAILDSSVGDQIKVIYIPRLLIKRSGRRHERLEVAEYVHNKYPELDIHLFGASSYWVQEVKAAARTGYIRSMDTSLPYNYAVNYITIGDDTLQRVDRLEDYFDFVLDAEQTLIAAKNVTTFKEWANGA